MKKSDFKLLVIGVALLVLISGIIYFIVNIDSYKVYKFDFNLKKRENYAANEVIATYVDEETLVQNYYKDFITLLIYNREEAYKSLKTDIKKEDYPTIDEFNTRIEQMMENNLLYSEVKEYRKGNDEDKNVYYVTDTSNNQFTFIENSIMDYSVII